MNQHRLIFAFMGPSMLSRESSGCDAAITTQGLQAVNMLELITQVQAGFKSYWAGSRSL